MIWIKMLGVVALAFIGFVTFRFLNEGKKSQNMEVSLGVKEGKLLPCSSKPNCVSSFSPESDQKHFAAPLPIQSNPISLLKRKLSEKGFEVVSSSENYLHATETSRFFGFVDDFEALYDEDQQKLYFRFASRVGYSDLGANKKRVEAVVQMLGEGA